MIFGIATTTASETNLLSTEMSSSFFQQSVLAADTAAIDFPGFVEQGAMVTPIGPSSYSINGYSMHTAGAYSNSAQSYYPATKHLLYSTASAGTRFKVFGSISKQQSAVASFGARSDPSAGAFGGMFRSNAGRLLVDQDYKTFYVHKDSSGNALKTATANSLPSSLLNTPVSYFEQSKPVNVVFDKAFDDPPLIFVTKSSGPIAFNGMVRDAGGKYTGASIVAQSSYISPHPEMGTGGYGSNTFTFTYFIVSSDEPTHGASDHGMRVFNGAGEKVFDSAYFVPAITRKLVATPYAQITGNSAAATNYLTLNESWDSKTPEYGYCINNFPSIAGVAEYSSVYVDSGSGTYTLGPMTFFGRYMWVGSHSLYLSGQPTCAIYLGMSTSSYTTPAASFDFHLANCPTLDLFVAAHTRT